MILSAKEGGKAFNVGALLAPFSSTVWFYILGEILILSFLLSSSKWGLGYKHSLFWIYSVIFEQGDDQRLKRNRKNIYLLLTWMFGCFILRNFYTSEMYSRLTQQLPPTDLPETYKGIFGSTKYFVLTEPILASELAVHLQHIVKSRKIKPNRSASFFKQISALRVLVNSFDSNLSQLLKKGFQLQSNSMS